MRPEACRNANDGRWLVCLAQLSNVLAQIPLLNVDDVDKIADGTLVRYRGMVSPVPPPPNPHPPLLMHTCVRMATNRPMLSLKPLRLASLG